MWVAAVREKPRSLVAAQGLAVAGFLALAATTFAQDNFFVSSLFLLLAFYYGRKLVTLPKVGNRTAAQSVPLDTSAVREELAAMQAYYRRLQKGWQWVAGLGWVFTVLMAVFAPSVFIIVVVLLAGYAGYACARCRQAVRLIEIGLQQEGRD
ncbi:hypothetical protein SCACP_35700 [Sporomusa carbonis]|uniref:hypothetical protein n=1 Tax=Sporomusa carbonis TaxID=3076075 RepID=UPI003A6B33DD